MKKLIGIIAMAGALLGIAHAQNQIIATVPTYTNVTVKAADSNSTAVVLSASAFNISKVYSIRIVDTGGFASRIAFGTQASTTNAYSGTLSNGVPLAANGSITYGGNVAIPLLPLSAKTTTNGQTTTYNIEVLQTR